MDGREKSFSEKEYKETLENSITNLIEKCIITEDIKPIMAIIGSKILREFVSDETFESILSHYHEKGNVKIFLELTNLKEKDFSENEIEEIIENYYKAKHHKISRAESEEDFYEKIEDFIEACKGGKDIDTIVAIIKSKALEKFVSKETFGEIFEFALSYYRKEKNLKMFLELSDINKRKITLDELEEIIS
ncbi:hypothetical protein KKA09_01960 [Patescibacteria group bacterium]|nr:hypothetical protein [Patescibacteria group bacterium]